MLALLLAGTGSLAAGGPSRSRVLDPRSRRRRDPSPGGKLPVDTRKSRPSTGSGTRRTGSSCSQRSLSVLPLLARGLQQPLRRAEAEAADRLGARAMEVPPCRRRRARDHGHDRRRDRGTRHEPPAKAYVDAPKYITDIVPIGNLEVNYTIEPAKAGPNEIHSISSSRPAPANVDDVKLSATLPSQGLGPIRIPLQRIVPQPLHDSRGRLPAAGRVAGPVSKRAEASSRH